MKIRLLLLLVASIATAAAGCGDGGRVTGTGPGVSQIVSLIVYYDENDESVKAYGSAMGDPLPRFNYLKIGDSTSTMCRYDVGMLDFRTVNPVFGTWNRVDAEVSTSAGELSGSLDFPGRIKNVTVSDDTIPPGGSFVLSWTGNREYVLIRSFCDYYDLQNNMHHVDIDTVVAGQFCVFDLSFVPRNGSFTIKAMWSFTGARSEAGAEPNMTGTGTGFMAYFGSYLSVFKTVKIGYYSNAPEEYAPTPPTKEELMERAERKLLEMWGIE